MGKIAAHAPIADDIPTREILKNSFNTSKMGSCSRVPSKAKAQVAKKKTGGVYCGRTTFIGEELKWTRTDTWIFRVI